MSPRRTRPARLGMLAGACLLWAALAAAQAQPSQPDEAFGGWRVAPIPGDTLRVKTADGRDHKGVLSQLQPGSLTLLERGVPKQFAGPEVLQITRENSDPLGNGALKGAIIGAGFWGVIALLAANGGWCVSAREVAVGTVFYAGIGAAIGTGADAATREHTVLFKAATPRSSRRVSVAPLVTAKRTGVVVSVGW